MFTFGPATWASRPAGAPAESRTNKADTLRSCRTMDARRFMRLLREVAGTGQVVPPGALGRRPKGDSMRFPEFSRRHSWATGRACQDGVSVLFRRGAGI